MSSPRDMVAQTTPKAKQKELMFAELLSVFPQRSVVLNRSRDMKVVCSSVFNMRGEKNTHLFQQFMSNTGQLDLEISGGNLARLSDEYIYQLQRIERNIGTFYVKIFENNQQIP